ncbi:hypothetical protein GV792_10380 [Nocardia cyriacigeorgica]|uniref:NAD(P)H nitroreductase RV3131/MT3217 n=1 Tax=Nocardia cyriacigeorgica TaxID=135487 RepID=A0A6P1D5X8_9NOCA|nr:hypothetical protein [Nocardia cyriacigeorgica]NEW42012.1 hypothetical protein [Nocardia cyriacigeorgica]NEW44794.1 hypothetical protein [Nocardia cyriacigeorgica]NEW50460.1 hypothetical protein [Nocardia cyriacigeorgica]
MTNIDEVRIPEHPTVLAALRLACRAPSVHNTQPWRWVFDGTRLHLYGDGERRLHSADPQGRQLVISCGAMLHHVSTAFAARGWHTDITRLPDPTRRDHLAVLDFRPWPDPPDRLLALARAIDRRHTDRLPLLEPPHWAERSDTVRSLVSAYEIEFDLLDGSERPRLAAASEQSSALRRHDPHYQNELHWWAGNTANLEGIPASALASNAELSQVGVGREFPAGPRALRRGDLDDRAELAVLSSPDDAPLHWLRSGEALSAALLEFTVAGLATCPLTHITELPSSRRIIAGLIPRPGVPQVVVRVGAAPQGPEQPPTPRRHVAEFFSVDRSAR